MRVHVVPQELKGHHRASPMELPVLTVLLDPRVSEAQRGSTHQTVIVGQLVPKVLLEPKAWLETMVWTVRTVWTEPPDRKENKVHAD
jgi:hypothetical protein